MASCQEQVTLLPCLFLPYLPCMHTLAYLLPAQHMASENVKVPMYFYKGGMLTNSCHNAFPGHDDPDTGRAIIVLPK